MFDAVVTRVRPLGAAESPPVAVIPAKVLPGEHERQYDGLVLAYVARHYVVTLHQLLDFFFTSRGLGPAYGVRLVRQLVQAGLLTTERVRSGRAERALVELTPRGYRALQLTPPREPADRRHAMRPYRLQFADMLLQRRLEGFRFVNTAQGFPHLKRWALRHAGRARNSYDAQDRDRLRRMPPYDPTLPLLVRGDAETVRLVLPARPGLDPRALLERIPRMPFHPPVVFEIVCAQTHVAAGYLERAQGAVKLWSGRRRQAALWELARPWEERANPALASTTS